MSPDVRVTADFTGLRRTNVITTHTRALLRITATTRQIDTRSEESKKQPVEEKTNSQDGVETSVKH